MEVKSQTVLWLWVYAYPGSSHASVCDQVVWWSPDRSSATFHALVVHGCTFTLKHDMLLFILSYLFPNHHI